MLRDEVVRAETALSDLSRELAKAEGDVEQVVRRRERDQQRLDTGAVSSPKELENLQHELGSLARRQGDLEDVELEIMERREAAEALLSGFRSEQASRAAEHDAAVAARDTAYADMTAETDRLQADRAALVASLPADLVALYERVRAGSGGAGAAALHRGSCQGCHLQLPGSDLAALRAAPPDAVVRCEECGRILVRTPESGL